MPTTAATAAAAARTTKGRCRCDGAGVGTGAGAEPGVRRCRPPGSVCAVPGSTPRPHTGSAPAPTAVPAPGYGPESPPRYSGVVGAAPATAEGPAEPASGVWAASGSVTYGRTLSGSKSSTGAISTVRSARWSSGAAHRPSGVVRAGSVPAPHQHGVPYPAPGSPAAGLPHSGHACPVIMSPLPLNCLRLCSPPPAAPQPTRGYEGSGEGARDALSRP